MIKIGSRCSSRSIVAAFAATCASLATGGCVSTVEPAPQWHVQTSATAGTAIRFQHGGNDVTIACRRRPNELFVRVEHFRPVEDTLALRSGGHAVDLSTSGVGPQRGVEGAGPISEPFLFMLNSTQLFEIQHGNQRISLPGLMEEQRNTFAAACGQLR